MGNESLDVKYGYQFDVDEDMLDHDNAVMRELMEAIQADIESQMYRSFTTASVEPGRKTFKKIRP